ncbi:pif1 [Lambdina fiscellaria nucleopolyhedrovirus]|uniref:Pif1 n=1 Tax=Lambdina fiscellaria nucleopolyhedrovirus TaxID=1642929 RepID=A0A0E3Z5Z4_9ABAC|nr:pif1 [Lambdina fiscellaria nucleopolyhedrovirus]AKC91646.1 pif1 [Lambdina fiscellaria nucleopolyhedrovirus]
MFNVWYTMLAIATLILIVASLWLCVGLLQNNQTPLPDPLKLFDNTHVPHIEPPDTIVIEGNPVLCHERLTPCTTHMDCDVCREGLANCQYFNDRTIITMRDENGLESEHEILPGESYCLALDRNRARSCNPNTGLWLLAQTEMGFSLLCTCLSPGLVSQISMYHDCDVAVGCQPHGHVADINERPPRCECDEGFVAGYNEETQTPFCRSLTVRDVMYDENFFHRAPCQAGFVRVDHPALDDTYRREFRLNDICVPDPCSIDPISGERISGRLIHFKFLTSIYNYCLCPFWDNVYTVYSPEMTMVAPSTSTVGNACISPFTTSVGNLRKIYYKMFWGHSSSYESDDDIVAVVRDFEVRDSRYRNIMYPFLTSLPDNTNIVGCRILKFSTAHTIKLIHDDSFNILFQNLSARYSMLERETSAPCFYQDLSTGRCVYNSYRDCIRRWPSGQVWTAETTTNSWCYFSREQNLLRVWSPATRYPNGQFPIVFYVDVMFAFLPNVRENTTMHAVMGGKTVTGTAAANNLAEIMNTYSNYSIR